MGRCGQLFVLAAKRVLLTIKWRVIALLVGANCDTDIGVKAHYAFVLAFVFQCTHVSKDFCRLLE